MKPVTVWKRFDDAKRSFEHHHIEDGHVPRTIEKPIGKFGHQTKAWASDLWIWQHAYIDDDGKIT